MPKHKNVYCIQPTLGFDALLPEYGYTPWVCQNVQNAPVIDAVAWCGGSDISPSLYGQQKIPGVSVNPSRDEREVSLWNKYRDLPKFGICRGAQLLCALNGGSLYQNVDRHFGAHEIHTIDKKQVIVSSVHHQMMRPTPDMKVIAWSERSTYRDDDKGRHYRHGDQDPEVVWIPADKALCFQGHPEFGPKSCSDYFFQLVDEYLR